MQREPSPDFSPPSHPPPLLSDPELKELIEHGSLSLNLPPHLTKQYSKLSDTFGDIFQQPTERKRQQFPSLRGVHHGYSLIEDEKEFVTIVANDAQDDPELRKLLATVWRDTAAYLCRVLSDIARVLQIPFYAFDPLLDGCLALPPTLSQATPTLMRIFSYFPGVGVADRHTDLGFVTLCYSTRPGLQVWRQRDGSRGEWHDTVGATLLIGDSLRILGSARVKAGQHRVVPNAQGRSSIIFALRPSTRHWVELAPFGGSGTFHAKAFWEVLRGQRYNVNERREVREQQKLERSPLGNAAGVES